MTGNITLIGDTQSLANVTLTSTGIIDFSPRTTSGSIGVNGGTGTLQLDNSTLALVSTTTLPSLVIFGMTSGSTGAVNVSGTYAIGNTTFPLEIAGGCITTGGITESTTKGLTLLAGEWRYFSNRRGDNDGWNVDFNQCFWKCWQQR